MQHCKPNPVHSSRTHCHCDISGAPTGMEDYSEAIRETMLPFRPSAFSSRDSCFYDKIQFQEFVNNDMDLRDTSRHMTEFIPRSGDLALWSSLDEIRGVLQSKLQEHLGYGSLLQIGSFYDGSKTGRLNEMDCLYVVSVPDVEVQHLPADARQFKVYLKGIEIKPRVLNKQLIAVMKETMSEMTLPSGLTHSGYAFQDFSGVRCNGPAVTAMFCDRYENYASLNIAIAFLLTSQLQQRPEFPQELKRCCQLLNAISFRIQGQLTRTQVSVELHLICDPVNNTWLPTTAVAEANILRALKPDCPVKRVMEICKILAFKLQAWYREKWGKYLNCDLELLPIKKRRTSPEYRRRSILSNLHNYETGDPDSKAQLRDTLNADMAFQHIWLSSTDRVNHKEILKSDASINTTAIKHVILRTALQLDGAFSKTNMQLEQQLIRAVFEELSSTDSFYTQHAFLQDWMISKFSFSIYVSSIKEGIATGFFQQCTFLLDNAFAKVGLPMLFHFNRWLII